MGAGCHVAGSRAPAFLYGGTVYQANGTTAAAGVQVGVSDGTRTYSTYSASNGNFWLPSSAGTLDWSKALVRLRNATGETIKPAGTSVGAGCNGNGCHSAGSRITAP